MPAETAREGRMTRFLVTGATGFIGRRLTRLLTARGHTVTALVRPTARRPEPGVRCVTGDLRTGEGLAEAVLGAECVLHLAGVTKSLDGDEYFRGNAEATRLLAGALAARSDPPRLVYCSSLAAAGPSLPGRPRDERQPPAPVSLYGRSKLAGEHAVRRVSDRVPCVIVRPPIVYGPGDREFVPALSPLVRLGVVPRPGPRRYSLIHVDDLCAALLAAAEHGPTLSAADPVAGLYFVCDGVEYLLDDVCRALARALNRRMPLVVPVPGLVTRCAAAGSELLGRARGQVPMLNRDKARELRCPAWTCSAERAARDLGFSPAVSLRAGLAML
jgi:nucleoside-diphosphate-sugar epimerase